MKAQLNTHLGVTPNITECEDIRFSAREHEQLIEIVGEAEAQSIVSSAESIESSPESIETFTESIETSTESIESSAESIESSAELIEWSF